MPAIFKIELWHNGTLKATYDNSAWHGEGQPDVAERNPDGLRGHPGGCLPGRRAGPAAGTGGVLEDGTGYSLEKVKDFFTAWTPKK